MQRSGSVFEFGRNHHNHAAPVGGMVAAKIKCLVKQGAKQDVFRPSSDVVNDVLLGELTDAPCPSLPRFDSLQRTANRTRQQLRPQDPNNLDFELEEEHIPDGFFRDDVKVSKSLLAPILLQIKHKFKKKHDLVNLNLA